jgi:hypothetical protein
MTAATLRHAAFLAFASLHHAWMRSALLVVVLGISLGIRSRCAAPRAGLRRDARAGLARAARPRREGQRVGRPSSSARCSSRRRRRAASRCATSRGSRPRASRARCRPRSARPRATAVVGTTLDYLERAGLSPRKAEPSPTSASASSARRPRAELALGVGASLHRGPNSSANLSHSSSRRRRMAYGCSSFSYVLLPSAP